MNDYTPTTKPILDPRVAYLIMFVVR